ncbi:MAG TPA: Ldh family oxidoreductase [Chloroflexota bacterium]|nr:Ldh family oxidoreductase [Chloroflexota bacterium]
MIQFSADELREVATRIFRAAGADAEPTEILVSHLIDANLAGHDSHGVIRIPAYVQSLQKGQVQPNARPTILRETPVSALIDGGWTFGQVSARFGIDTAIAKAKAQGVAVVGVVRCNHIGRLGTYSSLAARSGVFAMTTVGNVGKSTAPFGGTTGAFGTNPFSFGFPAAERPDVMIDFATSAIAGGKVQVARAKHEPVPPGTLLDKDGRPTTDPNDYFAGGALLPFGGHKGSALATLSVLLSHALTGAADFVDDGQRGGSGTFMLAIDAGLFRDRAKVEAEADAVAGRIKDVPPAAGFAEVLVAGEPEVRTAERRRREGIPVPEDTWAEIVTAARSVGVTLELPPGG